MLGEAERTRSLGFSIVCSMDFLLSPREQKASAPTYSPNLKVFNLFDVEAC